MFEIGWGEILVIGVVALIVVGPKELPGMLRTFGNYMNKARSMARDFQRNMEQAAKDAGMEDVTKAARSVQDVGRIAAGGVSGLAQFGLDHTRNFATSAAAAKPPETPAVAGTAGTGTTGTGSAVTGTAASPEVAAAPAPVIAAAPVMPVAAAPVVAPPPHGKA